MNSPSPYEYEIDLTELFKALWSGKWLIAAIAVLSGLTTLVLVLMLPNTYRAEALLAPNSQDVPSGLSALAGQYASLVNLTGVGLGDTPTDKTSIGLEILQSRRFISEFIERHEILVPLMAARGWDWQSDELSIDRNIYDTEGQRWTRDFDPPQKAVPSMQEAYEEFSDRLAITQHSDSGLITVSFEFYSPHIARQWVEWLVEDVNDEVMQQDVSEAEKAIEYLNDLIDRTSLADLQSVFFVMIEENTKIVMLAKISEEYLLKTLDPAVAPEEAAGPNRVLWVLVAVVIGMFIGVLAQLFWVYAMPGRKTHAAN